MTGWLSACGPGTGGTGTGPNMGAALGNYSALVQSEPLPCASQCSGPASLAIDTERVELNLPCRRFVYAGHWAFDAQGRAELPGRWQQLVRTDSRTVVEEQSVQLILQVEPGALLQLLVTDAAGATVLGPLLLRQGGDADVAATCL